MKYFILDDNLPIEYIEYRDTAYLIATGHFLTESFNCRYFNKLKDISPYIIEIFECVSEQDLHDMITGLAVSIYDELIKVRNFVKD